MDKNSQGRRTSENIYNIMQAYANEQNKTTEQVIAELKVSNALSKKNNINLIDTNNTMFLLFFGTIIILLILGCGYLLHKWYTAKIKNSESYS